MLLTVCVKCSHPATPVREMNKLFWLKAFGYAVLTEVSLVAISLTEALMWAGLQSSPPSIEACEEHVHASAPRVSAGAGAILMYVFASALLRGAAGRTPVLALALLVPTAYVLVDVAILSFYPVDWEGHWPVLAGATVPKYLGALAAWRSSIRGKMRRVASTVQQRTNELVLK
jgi:hypothetical protein